MTQPNDVKEIEIGLLILFTICLTQMTCSPIMMYGAGTELLENVIESWITMYRVIRDDLDPLNHVDLRYFSDNTQFNRPATLKSGFYQHYPVVYIGNQWSLTAEEIAKYPDLVQIPVVAGFIQIGFNLPGISSLLLSCEIAADIFYGSITKWNHPSIMLLNPNIALPNMTIRLVVREDVSHSTYILTKAFSQENKNWKQNRGIFDDPKISSTFTVSKSWNSTSNEMFFITGKDGAAAVVASVPYSMGYIPASMADKWNLSVAELITVSNFTVDTDEKLQIAVRSAMDYYTESTTPIDMTMDLGSPYIPMAYPLAYFMYLNVNSSTVPQISCRQMSEFFVFVNYTLTNSEAQQVVSEAKLIALSSNVSKLVIKKVLDKLSCRGVKLQNEWSNQSSTVNSASFPVEAVIIPLLAVCLVAVSAVAYRRWRLLKTVASKNWMIADHEIKFGGPLNKINSYMSLSSIKTSLDDGEPTKGADMQWTFYLAATGRSKGKDIILFTSGCKRNPLAYKFESCKRLHSIQKAIHHPHIINLLGLMVKNNTIYHIYESPGKGCLHNVLTFSPYDLNENIKYMLSKDVASGLLFLHKHGLSHGILDTWNILLDRNWSAKVGNWSQLVLAELEGEDSLLLPTSNIFVDAANDETCKRLLFRHPDILSGTANRIESKHDLFSFAMILIEIFTREPPYSEGSMILGWRQILEDVLEHKKMPIMRADLSLQVRDLIQQLTRPKPQITFEGVLMFLTMNQPTDKGIVDTLLETMEHYMQHLEEKVEERTVELKAVTNRMESLLVSMLPRDVAMKLQNGQLVEPEYYQSTTVYFSDIVSFTTLCGESTPLQVIHFLNEVYTMFDNIIEQFDVYKVETIGDAYMCVSGLPRKNGEKHVEQIGKMALSLIEAIKSYKIPHKPNIKMQIRVGMNSGSVMSGVVGIKMPRYCLFGDTVNTASRMESTSLPNKIQASESSAELLQHFPEFVIEERGEMEVKGKGTMKTFWLSNVNSIKQLKTVTIKTKS